MEIEWDDAECEVTFDSERNIIRAEYETEDGEIYFDGREWHDEDGNEVDGPDLSFMRAYFDRYKIPSMWYGYNTMSLIGLSLRDMYPDLTKKWYQVVPVDLTQEGVFNFPTAVSNLFYFGGCTVTIRDGNVTTDYHIPRGEAYPKSDCLMWFTDIGEITSEFLNNPRGSYQFGQPVSIREDLKGRDIALLFICNQITYRDPLDNVGGGASAAITGATNRFRKNSGTMKACSKGCSSPRLPEPGRKCPGIKKTTDDENRPFFDGTVSGLTARCKSAPG